MLRRYKLHGWFGVVSLGLVSAVLTLRAEQPAETAQPPVPPGDAATPAPAGKACEASKPKYKLVEKTICVPEITMVPKWVKVTECRPEVRECCVTITRQIPHTTYSERECCIMKPVTHMRTECFTVCKPIITYKEVQICATEPEHKITPITHCVSNPIPTRERRTKIEDEGEWVEQPCTTACKPCKPGCKPELPATKKVWVSKPVEKEYFVTVWKPEQVEATYNKVCTTLKPVTRCTVVPCITGYCKECKTREVPYTVCVPCKVMQPVACTTYTTECVPMTKTYTVMVPHCVEKEIQVPVCRMVTKTITCQVPVCE